MSKKILIQFAHPATERSRVNRAMLGAVRDLSGVIVNDLYEEYPTMSIDVEREQNLLLEADVVVFQHPMYWYSVPAILKEWQDLVLEHKWAYGEGGDKLRGKTTLNVISTGGSETAYSRSGSNRFSVREFLAPWDQTAHLCGMNFLAPFVVHAALSFDSLSDVRPYLDAYRALVSALRDERIDLKRAAQLERLDNHLTEVISRQEQA